MASPASSDEGEILENAVGDLKATSLPQIHGTGVDRPDRNRAKYSRSRSPEYGNGSRYSQDTSRRSRSPRGFKRSRNDREFHQGGRLSADPRHFRVHYEDDHRDSRRSRYSYDDDDRPPSRSPAPGLRYDDRDRARDYERPRERSRDRDRDDYPEKRPRNRTRSPYRAPRGGRDRFERTRRDDDRQRRPSDRDQGRNHKYSHQDSPHHSHDHAMSKRATSVETTGTSKADTKSAKGPLDKAKNTSASAQVPEPEQNVQEEQSLDVDAEIERRRRRREELLSKSRGPTPLLAQALQVPEKTAASSPAYTHNSTPLVTEANTPRSAMSSPASPAPGLQEGMSPGVLHITSDQELINTHGKSRDTDDDGPSAADYDPTADMREDEIRDELRHGHIGPHGEILPPDEKAEIAPKEEPQPSKKVAADERDDDFDMFAEDFDEDKFAAPKPVVQLDTAADDRKLPATLAQPNGGGILEGDDKDGYYKIRIGEILNGRYQVQATLGKGMFSGVARAVDIKSKQMVAIKMMRNNDALRKGGYVEIAILQKLNDSDPESRKHIVKFERYFEHQGHLCLAFENLSLNLREVLRKFGNNVGINLNATRSYAHQMFVALAHMRKCTIIHADIKPDNILVSLALPQMLLRNLTNNVQVNESRNVLKICDLGTAYQSFLSSP
ncbi:hypothetical protein BJ170DRAFT_601675 [Xylariales sp. AK1849]|nr:hypothetical protein BJ170DRAFT_601675 [Xylariales sp. AK1849]